MKFRITTGVSTEWGRKNRILKENDRRTIEKLREFVDPK